jgi:hypothetical protein
VWSLPAFQWSNWEPLGGVLNGGPAVSSWGEGKLDVFVRGADNQLHHQAYRSDQNPPWRGWEALGGIHTSDPAAVSWGINRIDVFERGQNRQLWHMYHNGLRWSGWTSEGVSGLVTNGGPTVTSWGPGRLDLFARGTDNQLYHKWYSNNRWSDQRDGFPNGWQPLGGQLTSDPSAVAWSSGRIDVFAIGSSHNLIHRWFDDRSGGWSNWESLGGGPQDTSGDWIFVGTPAVSSWAPGRLDIVVKTDNERVYHKWYNGQWSGWDRVTPSSESIPNPNLESISWGNGRIDLFGTNPSNNNLMHKWFNLGDQLSPAIDTDGDGLINGWETNGIDSNRDGIIDFSLHAYGANPNHKDIFVEVDYMQFHAPYVSAMDNVIRAFALAPLEQYNPDRRPGINLHIQLDEQMPHVDTTRDSRVPFNQFFGTAGERSNVNLINAKKLAFHWSGFLHAANNPSQGGWCCIDGDDDFQVTLGISGAIDPDTGHRTGTIGDQSGNFMHELGHDLGLEHGGNDQINNKPNYFSIMNYAYTNAWIAPNTDRLDYNRCGSTTLTLTERQLNEQIGIPKRIGGSCGPDWETHYGPAPIVMLNTDGTRVRSNIPLNFDRIGNAVPTTPTGNPLNNIMAATNTAAANVNINNDPAEICSNSLDDDRDGMIDEQGCGTSPHLITGLTSPNDWTSLVYRITRPGIVTTSGYSTETSIKAVTLTQSIDQLQPEKYNVPPDDIPIEARLENMKAAVNSLDTLIQNLSNGEFKNPQGAAAQKTDLHSKLLSDADSIFNDTKSGYTQRAIEKLQNSIKPQINSSLTLDGQQELDVAIDDLIKGLQEELVTPADIAREQNLTKQNPPIPGKGIMLSEEDLEKQ